MTNWLAGPGLTFTLLDYPGQTVLLRRRQVAWCPGVIGQVWRRCRSRLKGDRGCALKRSIPVASDAINEVLSSPVSRLPN